MLTIEVIYITPSITFQKTLEIFEGALVSDALTLSGLMASHPEACTASVGIFSSPATRDTPLKQGDRIEVYRPLLIDPKASRRARAKK